MSINHKTLSLLSVLVLFSAVLFTAGIATASEPMDSQPCSVVGQTAPATATNGGFMLVCNGTFWESCGFSPQRPECTQTPPTCPTGYTLINGVCTPPTGHCPTGYTLVNGVCTPPTTNCPTGYTLVNGVCTPPTGSCPTGYTLVNGRCVPPNSSCPTGYTLVNDVCTPPTNNCPAGYTLVNGYCTPPTTNCPSGYDFINGYCRPPTYNPPTYNYPICNIYVSSTQANYNQGVTISWSSQYASYGSITYIGSVGLNGSITVYPRQTTTYTGTFYGYNGQQATCSATVYVNQYIPPSVVYNPPPTYAYTPHVTLAAVPYTGLDLGPVGTTLYSAFLILVALIASYLVLVKKLQNRIAGRVSTFLFGDESR